MPPRRPHRSPRPPWDVVGWGVLNEVPAVVEHEYDPPAAQCESQAPPGLLEGDGLARPVVDVECPPV